MSSLTASLSPTSFQLRLTFSSRKPSNLLVRVHVGKKDYNHRLHLLSIGGKTLGRNGNGLERHDFLVNSVSSADEFAGWSGADEAERSNDAEGKQSIAGLLGAGVAGIVLVAGIIFATLSVSKHNMSRSKQRMDPLKTQQVMTVVGDDHIDTTESKSSVLNNKVNGSDNLDINAVIDGDPFLHPENHKAADNILSDGSDTGHTFPNSYPIGKAPTKHGSHNEAVSDETSFATELFETPDAGVSESFSHSSFETKDASFASRKPGLLNEQYEEDFDDKHSPRIPAVIPSLTNQSIEPQGVSNLNETGDSNSSCDLPSPEAVNSQSASMVESMVEDVGIQNVVEIPTEADNLVSEAHDANRGELSTTALEGTVVNLNSKEQKENTLNRSTYSFSNSEGIFVYAGIPAPSSVSESLQALPGKVLVPAAIDEVHSQALAALQVLKVIEADVQPGDLCTRREYARWLVASSCALSRSIVSKIYPAMYIENVTELAFDDITTEDPDFPFIQGLAEAGLISSKLSRGDMQSPSDGEQSPIFFSPDSPLSRQDLLSWKMALEKRQLPIVDQKMLKQLSGFIDIDKIHPDAWPALAADLASGEHGIIALAFGYTRLFQPDKPVTKAQAAIALATGEAYDVVSEELARIEAESMAEKAVTIHKALIAEVEKDVNAIYEKELSLEREKINAVRKLAEDARLELEKIQAEWEEENLALLKERATVDSEMEVFSRLRSEVEEQLQTLVSNKLEISHDKEKLKKLREDVEHESQEISRLQYELEVERKALSMARAWAEDEAKRARDQAKALKEARDRWEKHGIKVVVDDELQEEANAGVTWLSAGKQLTIEGTVGRAETLEDKLRGISGYVRGKSKDMIHKIMEKIHLYITILRKLAQKGCREAVMLKDTATAKMSNSLHSVKHGSAEFGEGVKRFAGDCKQGVEKISQKFKT
ncbi:unnamed protein product [Cuscuta campestris]|uniref:SLH domain-containing protein n=1 Tax=Cuscuta campestris TaxID=132261 RepID=A0A484NFE8_9ASTE|nr:unnamed protein product [Cuscuta campestris]